MRPFESANTIASVTVLAERVPYLAAFRIDFGEGARACPSSSTMRILAMTKLGTWYFFSTQQHLPVCLTGPEIQSSGATPAAQDRDHATENQRARCGRLVHWRECWADAARTLRPMHHGRDANGRRLDCLVGLESMDESSTLLWGAPLNHPSPSPLTSCASNLARGSGRN
jgi:hypothetical protein